MEEPPKGGTQKSRHRTLPWRAYLAIIRDYGRGQVLRFLLRSRREPLVVDTVSSAVFADTESVVWNVDLSKCASYYYYRFGSHGWSPFQEIARRALGGASRRILIQDVQRFYNQFQPTTLSYACFGALYDFPEIASLGPYTRFKPWHLTTPTISGAGGEGNQNFGPVSPKKATLEVDRVLFLLQSLAKHGYRPDRFRNGYVQGYALTAGDDYRFVITGGVHRAAVMSALGHNRLLVAFDRKMPRFIERSSHMLWPQVCTRACSTPTALTFFDSYFQENKDFRKEFF